MQNWFCCKLTHHEKLFWKYRFLTMQRKKWLGDASFFLTIRMIKHNHQCLWNTLKAFSLVPIAFFLDHFIESIIIPFKVACGRNKWNRKKQKGVFWIMVFPTIVFLFQKYKTSLCWFIIFVQFNTINNFVERQLINKIFE